MSHFRAYKAYQQTQVQNPLRVTVMAYEWCLNNLRYAQVQYEQNVYEKADERLLNTEQILQELKLGLTTEDNTLPEEMKEMVLTHAKQLGGLYDWLITETERMRLTKQTEQLPTIMSCIQDQLEACRYAIEQQEKGQH